MKTLLGACLLLIVMPLWASSAPPISEARAVTRLRDLYRQVDMEQGAREGRALVVQFPASTELRAWYVANLAKTDATLALRLARDLRYAHPSDSWSWFALTLAQLENEDEENRALESAQK